MPVTIPLRGFLAPYPRALDTQNPQLIPSMDFPSTSGLGGTIDVMTPAKYLATYPRVDGTVTLTIGGTITNLDTITLKFTNAIIPAIGSSPQGAYSMAAYTVVTADTVATVADGLEALINQDANLAAMGIYAVKAGTSNGARLVIHQGGPVANFTTVSATITGGATETATFGNSGVLAGGSGPIVPTETFHWSYNGTQQNFWYGKPQNVDSGFLASLIAGQAPIQ